MKYICKACTFGLIGFIIFSCSRTRKEYKSKAVSSIRDSIFFSPYGGYGYDIIENGKVKIHQPHIPVLGLQLGFASVEDARRTAQLIISKMKQNQFPPQLTNVELKELGIVW